MNPYLIEGPASIGVSGGRTSGKMLREILDACGGTLPPQVYPTFENTGRECEETLEFLEEISIRWKVPIVWLEYDDVFKLANYRKKNGELCERRKSWGPGDWGFKVVTFKTASRHGEPYDKMLEYYRVFRDLVKNEKPILPTVPARMCTTHLKIKTNTRYMASLGYSNFDFIVGIRRDEPKRWVKMMKQNEESSERYENVCPLYDAGVTKADVKDFWSKQPFDLKLDAESYEGNCRYCFLKSTDKLVNLMRKNIAKVGAIPEDLQWWADKEQAAGMNFRRDRLPYSGLIQLALSTQEIHSTNEGTVDCLCGEAND